MSGTIVRRDFLKCALATALAAPALGAAGARAAGLTPLDPSDPTAQSLGFVADSSAATANSSFKAGQRCGVCMQYQGALTDARAGCSIYPGHSVPVNGWCGAFAARG
jgi:High potential iron-sulfur protein